jgi:hypothetical protein
MKVFEETTVWESKTPNHIYFLDDSKSKMYAYVKFGEGKPFRFKNPIRIDVRGRKFREVPNQWGLTVDDQPLGRTWKIQGSKGDVYTVTDDSGTLTCSCSGFKFRGACKHIGQINR